MGRKTPRCRVCNNTSGAHDPNAHREVAHKYAKEVKALREQYHGTPAAQRKSHEFARLDGNLVDAWVALKHHAYLAGIEESSLEELIAIS